MVQPRLGQSIRGLFWITLAGAIVISWRSPSAKAPSTPELRGLTVIRDLPYISGFSDPRLDLYLPAMSGPAVAGSSGVGHPVILAIHGGSWTGGSRVEFGRQVARFTRHGFAVVVPDYALARPGSPTRELVVEQLREAVRWVRGHAGTYHLDSGHVAALGAGAGGHLALLLGTLPDSSESERPSSRVQAVIDFYGPIDLAYLRSARELSHEPVDLLLGEPNQAQLRAASPLEHLSADDPPTLIFHGSDDRWVSSEQSRELQAGLERAGVRHRLIILPGVRHGFGLKVEAPEEKDLVPMILEFLDSAWNLPARTPDNGNDG